MALLPCQECGKEISDKAPACVNCGAPVQTEIKNKANDYLPEGSSAGPPLFPCRICKTEVLRKAYVCPNCGIRNPDTHKNKVANTGLFLLLFSLILAANFDHWFQWGPLYKFFGFSLMSIICMGFLWCLYQKVLE